MNLNDQGYNINAGGKTYNQRDEVERIESPSQVCIWNFRESPFLMRPWMVLDFRPGVGRIWRERGALCHDLGDVRFVVSGGLLDTFLDGVDGAHERSVLVFLRAHGSYSIVQRWAKKWSLGCENFQPGRCLKIPTPAKNPSFVRFYYWMWIFSVKISRVLRAVQCSDLTYTEIRRCKKPRKPGRRRRGKMRPSCTWCPFLAWKLVL